ncbi:MAG TPA: hypothetical protein VI893_09010 [Thermoplasmata archaeon]|nr:hypothetical protein [Thermoplasmata archaeon]
MFRPIAIPRQVLAEIGAGEAWDRAGVTAIREEVRSGLIRVRDVKVPPSFQPGLDLGERAALFLATRGKRQLFIADEEAARSVARAYGLRCVSTPFILLRAVERRLARPDQVAEDLAKLIDLGYHISPTLYNSIIEELDDLPRGP